MYEDSSEDGGCVFDSNIHNKMWVTVKFFNVYILIF